MKKFFPVILSFLIFLLSAPQAKAFSFSITGAEPSSIDSKEQEISVTLSITDLPAGDSYFRVAWESGSTYVGYIKNNNGDWVKLGSLTSDKDSQGCLNYFRVSTSTSQLVLSAKIGGDNELANGTVNLKAHRFTSTCGSNTGSNLFPMIINLPTLTPSPTVEATQAPTAAPTATPTKSPTPVPTKSPTPKPTKNPTPEPEVLGKAATSGEPTNTSGEPELTPDVSSANKKKPIVLPIIFIGSGVLMIGFALYNLIRAKASTVQN